MHESYLKLFGSDPPKGLLNQQDFFAANAMRQILVDRARSKQTEKRGGDLVRVDLDQNAVASSRKSDELLAVDEALTEYQQVDPVATELVKLRYFAGLTHQQVADVLGLTRRQADLKWKHARGWLYKKLRKEI